jgi:hypothetical protein
VVGLSEETYNGWKNYDTWNVQMWLSNEEPYYRAVVEFMKDYKGDAPYKDFLIDSGLDTQSTPDGAKYMGADLDFGSLNDFMFEFSPQGTRA